LYFSGGETTWSTTWRGSSATGALSGSPAWSTFKTFSASNYRRGQPSHFFFKEALGKENAWCTGLRTRIFIVPHAFEMLDTDPRLLIAPLLNKGKKALY
jgi:hypothetical protein